MRRQQSAALDEWWEPYGAIELGVNLDDPEMIEDDNVLLVG